MQSGWWFQLIYNNTFWCEKLWFSYRFFSTKITSFSTIMGSSSTWVSAFGGSSVFESSGTEVRVLLLRRNSTIDGSSCLSRLSCHYNNNISSFLYYSICKFFHISQYFEEDFYHSLKLDFRKNRIKLNFILEVQA